MEQEWRHAAQISVRIPRTRCWVSPARAVIGHARCHGVLQEVLQFSVHVDLMEGIQKVVPAAMKIGKVAMVEAMVTVQMVGPCQATTTQLCGLLAALRRSHLASLQIMVVGINTAFVQSQLTAWNSLRNVFSGHHCGLLETRSGCRMPRMEM